MKKRLNGEGSWGKKTIRGNQYYYFRDPDMNYTYGKSQKEVKRKLEEKKASEEEFSVSNTTTFGEYILEWVKFKKGTIEKTTYEGYYTNIKTMIIDYKDYDLNNKTLNNLSPRVFQMYLNSLANTYSRSTIKRIWILIKQCVRYGEIQKDIKPNTLLMVKVPLESNVAVKKKEIPFINNDELDQLYDLLENYTDESKNVHRFKYSNNAHAVILIAYTGMRVGEMIALKWRNVNMDEGYIDITESSSIVKDENNNNVAIDKVAKTASSIRRVPLPERGMEMIRYFDEFNPEHTPDDLVCLSDKGTRMNKRNVNRTLDYMCNKTGLPHMGVHSLRHSYGSILLNKGVDIKTISNLLGHKSITTTYNIYIGVDESTKANAVKVFDE